MTAPPAALLLALALAAHAQAQIGLAAEGWGGATFPAGDLSNVGVEAGIAMGAAVLVGLHPSLAAYLGFDQHRFTCDENCTVGDDPRSSGLVAGLRYTLPSPPDAMVWIRGGVTAHQYSDAQADGPRSASFEAGLGIDMIARGPFYFSPQVRYLRYDAAHGHTATYLTFGLALQYRFR